MGGDEEILQSANGVDTGKKPKTWLCKTAPNDPKVGSTSGRATLVSPRSFRAQKTNGANVRFAIPSQIKTARHLASAKTKDNPVMMTNCPRPVPAMAVALAKPVRFGNRRVSMTPTGGGDARPAPIPNTIPYRAMTCQGTVTNPKAPIPAALSASPLESIRRSGNRSASEPAMNRQIAEITRKTATAAPMASRSQPNASAMGFRTRPIACRVPPVRNRTRSPAAKVMPPASAGHRPVIDLGRIPLVYRLLGEERRFRK